MEQKNKNNSTESFIQKNKNLLIAVGAIIIVVVLALMLPRMNHTSDTAPADTDTAMADTAATDETMTSSVAPKSASSWDETLQKNKDTMLTIGDMCAIAPATFTAAKGTTVIVVNNTEASHTVAFDGATYGVGIRHYKTLRLNNAGDFKVGCDDKDSAATITVQ